MQKKKNNKKAQQNKQMQAQQAAAAQQTAQAQEAQVTQNNGVEGSKETKFEAKIVGQLKELGLYTSVECVYSGFVIFNKPVLVYGNTRVANSKLDAYSYVGTNSFVKSSEIGRYCSLGMFVEVGMPNHDVASFTTSTAVYNQSEFNYYTGNIEPDKDHHPLYADPVRVGNDVWIGDGAKITKEVTIGTGAVIGAGAIITKDVPPYAMMVGVNRHIKNRFSDEVISDLLESKWWEYDFPSMIAKGINVPLGDAPAFLEFLKNHDLSTFPKIPNAYKFMHSFSSGQCSLTDVAPDYSLIPLIKKAQSRE